MAVNKILQNKMRIYKFRQYSKVVNRMPRKKYFFSYHISPFCVIDFIDEWFQFWLLRQILLIERNLILSKIKNEFLNIPYHIYQGVGPGGGSLLGTVVNSFENY
jgi:hypothetical protein